MKRAQKQTFLFISSALATSWYLLAERPLLDPEAHSTKIAPESSRIPQISGA